MPQEKFVDMGKSSVFSNIYDMKVFPHIWNKYAFENANVQKFIKSTGFHFEVIVAEDFFGDSFLMFSHKFKAPVVTICPFGVTDFIDRQQGLLSSPSFVPHWVRNTILLHLHYAYLFRDISKMLSHSYLFGASLFINFILR